MARLIDTYDSQLNKIAHHNQKLKNVYEQMSTELSQKVIDLSTRENQLMHLKSSVDHMAYQNESLKKINEDLVKDNESRIKELTSLHQDVEKTESFTIIEKKESKLSNQIKGGSQKINLNVKTVHKDIKGNQTPPLSHGPPLNSKTSFDPAAERKPYPITVNYGNPSSDPN